MQEEEHSKHNLSISQRAYIIAKDLRSLTDLLRNLLIINIFFLSLGWANTVYHFDPTFHILVYLELTLMSVYILFKFLRAGPNAYKRLKEWNEDYLEQTYILVFDTTIPKGDNTGEKILNLARAIFPELIFNYKLQSKWDRIKYFLRRKISKYETESISGIANYKINSDYVDLVLRTPEGYFIVKDFNETIITAELLAQLIKNLNRKFRIIQSIPPRTNIFRVICVSKQYDQGFLNTNSLESVMRMELKRNFKLDLILEEKVGYSVLWVDS